jgi:DNA repair protein RadA/Sms
VAVTKKTKTAFVCQECGTHHVKWQGRCNGCGAWNTLVEETQQAHPNDLAKTRKNIVAVQASAPKLLANIQPHEQPRIPLADGELMRVLDGGVVPGSLILLGGEPGIGKSTLFLQLALQLQGRKVLYVAGEESEQQVKLRAERLANRNDTLYILAETALEDILQHAAALAPDLLIVDSIQTLYMDQLESAPGSIAQVRECAARLMRYAKESAVPVLLIGHINKDGMIAGPKVLEHMVDVVLEFEGDRHAGYRIVRSTKNRFGATPELGIYEMRADGLLQVPNPSEVFLSHSGQDFSGVAIAVTLQAQRPLLIETQALVSEAAFGTPQRSATGFDTRRLNMLLAVLEKKAGLKLGGKDVFINLAGGLRLDDTALDLALVAAIVSSLYDMPIGRHTAFAAEVGLTGEVCPVVRVEPRMLEAEKLGFKKLIVSAQSKDVLRPKSQLKVVGVNKLEECLREIFAGA